MKEEFTKKAKYAFFKFDPLSSKEKDINVYENIYLGNKNGDYYYSLDF